MKLYHASTYNVKTLKPSYLITSILVKWDKTESNKFLYTSANQDVVLDQGFASLIESLVKVHRYSSTDKTIDIYLEKGEKIPQKSQYEKRALYLYVIDKKPADGWVKVNNEVNKMVDEYKTDKEISTAIDKVETHVVKDFLKDKKLTFHTSY